ncbi:MAG: peptidylprolyl isomerase [Edaphocola sp.]
MDKIVGQVGNRIVLQSDVMELYNQEKDRATASQDTVRCNIFYTLMAQQILIEQAGRDSVIVTDEEVDNLLDNRIRSMMQQYGSKEAFEEANGGRTIYQLKDEFKSFFKDRQVADKMQNRVMENVKVTPVEVERFYKSLPQDSLPPFPASVEMGQIVIKPDAAPEIDQMTKEKLESIRKQIVEDGKSFATMAGIYSQDGTKDNGGELEIQRKGAFDPTFLSAAFRLQPGEISPVIKTKFGYHIIQMVRRMGDDAVVRHIILIPDITNADLQLAVKKLDSVRADLLAGKITFAEAVGKYSTDEMSKMTGGIVYDDQGNSVIAMEKLDGDMARVVGEMKVGEYAQPQIFTDPQGTGRAVRILYLKSRTDPHILNLKDDYAKIQDAALRQKRGQYLTNWLNEKSGTYFMRIDPEYQGCGEVKGWATMPQARN